MTTEQTRPTLGVVFRPQSPPEHLRNAVIAADQAGVAEFWLWEDCFLEGGLTAATAALSWSDRIRVGIGLMPVPFRNAALAAMEIATLARLWPDRFIAGLGHGVQDWMVQVGAAVPSPMTLLREHTNAIRDLLAGQTVDTAGKFVTLANVRLDWPPTHAPELLIGARGPRTIRLAGELSDGVILEGGSTPDYVRAACRLLAEGRALSGRDTSRVVVYAEADPTKPGLVARMAEQVAELAEAGADSIAFLATSEDVAPEPLIAALAELG